MATKSAKPGLKPVAAPEPEAVAAPAKKKKPLLLIAVALLVLILGGGGAAWYFTHGSASDAAGAAKDAKAKEKPKVAKPPVFVNLEPFTVNLSGGDHFLQLGVVLQVTNDETAEAIKNHLPQIRNRLLLLLSSKLPAQLNSLEDKQKLADEILADTRQPLGEEEAKNVETVLFSSMVIQ